MMIDDTNNMLKLTVRKGQLDELKRLIATGVDMNKAISDCGDSALHHAADTNQLEVARLLIAGGADVNLKAKVGSSDLTFGNLSGETPIHIAAVRSDVALIKLLLDSGADKTLTTADGHTPYDYAVDFVSGGEIEQFLYTVHASMNDQQIFSI